jgi:hypothetical protein
LFVFVTTAAIRRVTARRSGKLVSSTFQLHYQSGQIEKGDEMETRNFSDVTEFPSIFFGFISAKGKPCIFVHHEPRLNAHFVYWLDHWIHDLAESRGENLVVHPLHFIEGDSPFFSDVPRRPWRGFDFEQRLCCDCETPTTSDSYLFVGVLLKNESYGWFFPSTFDAYDISDNERMFVEHVAFSIWGDSEQYKNVVRIVNDILLERQAVAK